MPVPGTPRPKALCHGAPAWKSKSLRERPWGLGVRGCYPTCLNSDSKSKLRKTSILKTGRQSVVMATLDGLLTNPSGHGFHAGPKELLLLLLTHTETATPPCPFQHSRLCQDCPLASRLSSSLFRKANATFLRGPVQVWLFCWLLGLYCHDHFCSELLQPHLSQNLA